MSNMLPILRKELRSYFLSPAAYIVVTVFLLICGWFFSTSLFVVNQASMRNVFTIIPFVFTFLVPAITMRLLSEEKKTGTFELLVTMPISDIEVILGKYLASLVLLAVAVGLTATNALTIAILGKADNGATFAGYIGLLLLGAGYLAIGILASSLTENQIVAFLLISLVICVVSLVDNAHLLLPTALDSVLVYLSRIYLLHHLPRRALQPCYLVHCHIFHIIGLYLAARAPPPPL